MAIPFGGKPWYDPERDGSLNEYLNKHDGYISFPLFKGYEHYQLLWDEGYLEPYVSAIRVMWNIGRDDEHYLVKSELELEGLEGPRHAGKPGVHGVRDILTDNGPPWEAHHLIPRSKLTRPAGKGQLR